MTTFVYSREESDLAMNRFDMMNGDELLGVFSVHIIGPDRGKWYFTPLAECIDGEQMREVVNFSNSPSALQQRIAS